MTRPEFLLRRIRLVAGLFVLGLVLSGATALPLEWELDTGVRVLGIADRSGDRATGGWTEWILRVRNALHETNARFPFVAYGTDWLAFAHFVIAIALLGAIRNPVRNVWLFQFGMIACVLVVPYALLCGGLRGIPFGWRLIDCSFGVVGFPPLWLCHRWTAELARPSTGGEP